MAHKLNISEKGKAWKLEIEPSVLNGKSLGNTISGKEIKPELDNYELQITGGSDSAGFPMHSDSEGIGRRKELFTLGWGMHKKPKGEKKKGTKPKGLRLRKTIAGSTIHDKTVQINMKVIKEGSKKLAEIFPDQNKAPEPKVDDSPKAETSTEAPTTTETPKVEEKIAEEIKEEVKEEIKEDIPSSPETKTEEKKEEAAEEIAEEIKEEVKEVTEDIAKNEAKSE